MNAILIVKISSDLEMSAISDYAMVVEYRKQSTKEYKVNLDTKTWKTDSSGEICVKFELLLNRANPGFYFLFNIFYAGKTDEETLEYQRYVADSDNNSVSKWENVSFTATVKENAVALLLFQIVIPQGSQGFYAAVDNVQLSNKSCDTGDKGKWTKYLRQGGLTLANRWGRGWEFPKWTNLNRSSGVPKYQCVRWNGSHMIQQMETPCEQIDTTENIIFLQTTYADARFK